jgi:hypothetical protein
MNERIKELIKQATTIHYSGPGEIQELNPEKFAELIVAECIEVFSKDIPDPTSPDYKLGTLNEVVGRVCNVVEHFYGVEG